MELEIYDAFQAAGVPEAKAKAAVEAINKTIDNRYAVHARELATRGDVEKVRVDMEKLRGEFSTRIEASKSDILRWFVTGIIGQTIALGYLIVRITPTT